MLQYVTVIIILILSVIFIVLRVRHTIIEAESGCYGCQGCALKKQIQANKRHKRSDAKKINIPTCTNFKKKND